MQNLFHHAVFVFIKKGKAVVVFLFDRSDQIISDLPQYNATRQPTAFCKIGATEHRLNYI